MIGHVIKQFVQYGIDTGLTLEEDRIYTINLVLDVLELEKYEEPSDLKPESKLVNQNLEKILKKLLDYGVLQGILKEDNVVSRDLLDTKLMNCLMPRPSEVITEFYKLYSQSPVKATNYYYKLSQNSDYIRRYRIKKDVKWQTDTKYGKLDITINLSKPEKDPKAIAAARHIPPSGYPKCLLCKENEGYAGNVNHPARQNHRVIPIQIEGNLWGFQYSPYVYYNEHCIVFHGEHIPMKIDRHTFIKLFDFVKLFPHYFIGSNADLPIVGGSILSHDHFQGGNYQFAMADAPIDETVTIRGYEGVEAGIVKWPMSVLRIRHEDETRLVEAAVHILDTWRNYTDEDSFVYASTNQESHNTITPIARKTGIVFELDLVLRNNITTEEYPMGVFHPHNELHHIKKENIGLIEVMGLAVLPSRLKDEFKLLGEFLVEGKDIKSHEEISKHGDWAESLLSKYGQITQEKVDTMIQDEAGLVFEKVLEHAGVYKWNDAGRMGFHRFIDSL